MYWNMLYMKDKMQAKIENWKEKCLTAKHPAIDGILVTVGLCIIALVLCVLMRDSLEGFIETLMKEMTTKAQGMLQYDPTVVE